MTLHLSNIAAKDGAGTTVPSGLQAHDTSGTGAGPFNMVNVLVDSTGAEILGTKADAKSSATDTTAVSSMSVWKQISASIQAAAASLAGTLTATIAAGTALIGKVGIDQTTPGTTNKVSIGTDGTVAVNAALPAGANVIGAVTANAGTNLNTSALALETGGNLATLVSVHGAKTDAKASTTDATSISLVQILKQISFSMQAAAASVAGTLTVATHAVTAAASAFADGAIVTLGAKADAKSTATDTTAISAMSVFKQISASVQSLVTGTVLAAGAAIIGLVKISDGTNTATVKAASTAAVATDTALVVAISPNSVNANGQATKANSAPVAIASDQSWPTGMSPRGISVAFSTLTRPANTTAYAAGDSISDNATAGSVTALTATVSDTNDDPVTLTELLVSSTDTGLAGKKIRAYLFNSDPTASTGVGGGDNAAYSQKKAGYIGSMSGTMEAGFSDGSVGRLVPSYNDGSNTPAGGFIVAKPVSGAKTLFIQYQAVEAITPSANSTTIIGTLRGFQGRAS